MICVGVVFWYWVELRCGFRLGFFIFGRFLGCFGIGLKCRFVLEIFGIKVLLVYLCKFYSFLLSFSFYIKWR